MINYNKVDISTNNYQKMKGTITLCILFTILFVVDCQVLGIDFGTQFWKAALISPGKNLVIV